jgi:hypothetical protein
MNFVRFQGGEAAQLHLQNGVGLHFGQPVGGSISSCLAVAVSAAHGESGE